MSFRFDTPLIASAYHFGNRGLGVLGSAIPSTGANGPSYMYNDLVLPADANKEYSGFVVTPPGTGTFFAYEDGSFTYTGASTSFVYNLREDGVDKGNQTVTITMSSNPSATVGWTEANDTSAITASVTATTCTATVSYTESNDTSALSGNVATASDTTNPSMNGALTITAITTGGFTATWTSGSDNVGVLGYEISIDTGTPSYTQIGSTLTYTATGLFSATLYNIRVRAFDAAGNRAVPLVTTATTSVAGSGFPFITPAHKNITTVVVPPLVTLSTASPYTIAYNVGLSQELVLYNKTGSDVTVNIKGNDHTVPVPQGGDSVFAITGGLNVNVPANNFTVVSLDKCYAYLLGDIAITASVNAAVSICFVS